MNKLVNLLLGAGLLLTESRKRHQAGDRLTDRLDELTGQAARTFENAVGRVERLYKVARGDNHRIPMPAVSFLIGIGIGAGVGLLFAPARGSEIRNIIAGNVQRFQADIRGRVHGEAKTA